MTRVSFPAPHGDFRFSEGYVLIQMDGKDEGLELPGGAGIAHLPGWRTGLIPREIRDRRQRSGGAPEASAVIVRFPG